MCYEREEGKKRALRELDHPGPLVRDTENIPELSTKDWTGWC